MVYKYKYIYYTTYVSCKIKIKHNVLVLLKIVPTNIIGKYLLVAITIWFSFFLIEEIKNLELRGGSTLAD